MPVPWEALIPFGLLTAMFGAAGTLLNTSYRAQNQGKPPRYHVDRWEEMMMRRDERLTGPQKGRVAPAEFATNSVWHAERLKQ
ncbi:small secreted protein [Amanita rubescens]|nr:small secreted protein [Amanita rubescens]